MCYKEVETVESEEPDIIEYARGFQRIEQKAWTLASNIRKCSPW